MSCAIGGEVDSSLVDNDLLLVRSGSRGCRECREVDSSVVDVGGLLVAGTVASDVDGGTDYVTFVVVGGLEFGPVLMLSNVDSAGAVGGLMMRRRVVMVRLFEGWLGKVVATRVRMVLLRLQRKVWRGVVMVMVVVVLGLGNDHRTSMGAVGAVAMAMVMLVSMDMLRLVHLDDIVVRRVVGVRTMDVRELVSKVVNKVVLAALVVFLVLGRVSAVDVGELVSEVVNEMMLVLLVVLLVVVVVALVLVKVKVRDMGQVRLVRVMRVVRDVRVGAGRAMVVMLLVVVFLANLLLTGDVDLLLDDALLYTGRLKLMDRRRDGSMVILTAMVMVSGSSTGSSSNSSSSYSRLGDLDLNLLVNLGMSLHALFRFPVRAREDAERDGDTGLKIQFGGCLRRKRQSLLSTFRYTKD